MQKTLIVLIVGMLAVGCASTPSSRVGWPNLTMKNVAGAYELTTEYDAASPRVVLLDNGVFEGYRNGEKDIEGKWKIVDGDIHVVLGSGGTGVLIINKDGSITQIAWIRDRKRADIPKDEQVTLKKIK